MAALLGVIPLLGSGVAVAAPLTAGPDRLCPDTVASAAFTTPTSEATWTVYVPARATLRIEGSADIRAKDTTGGWQTILYLDPVMLTKLGEYRGGPFTARPFSGKWTQGATGGDVTLRARQKYGTDVTFRFTATVAGGAADPACVTLSPSRTTTAPDTPGSPGGTTPPVTSPSPSTGTPPPTPSTTSSSTPAPTQVVTPDIKLVRFLQVPMTACVKAMARIPLTPSTTVGNRNPAADRLAACGVLVGSTNPTPPDRLDDDRWRKFKKDKEYRGYTHLPAYTLYCASGRVRNTIPHHLDNGISPGFTPTIFRRGGKTRLSYEKAEYHGSEYYSSKLDQVRDTVAGDGVVISFRVAARIASKERGLSYAALGHDAPYIWSTLHVRIGCDGSYQIVTSWSTIPRLAVYVDDKLVTKTAQTGDLAEFIISGGTKLNRAGKGHLYPECDTMTVATRGVVTHPVPATIDCRTARDNAGLDVERTDVP
ncbi:hypothetical protein [Actinoplanes sp. NPDC026670]|uniref:hypothetical protein n=1 Tax=Actinoplanes sp. NPDC026670 TaxID=3154700 RepID=UPI0033DE5FF0